VEWNWLAQRALVRALLVVVVDVFRHHSPRGVPWLAISGQPVQRSLSPPFSPTARQTRSPWVIGTSTYNLDAFPTRTRTLSRGR